MDNREHISITQFGARGDGFWDNSKAFEEVFNTPWCDCRCSTRNMDDGADYTEIQYDIKSP